MYINANTDELFAPTRGAFLVCFIFVVNFELINLLMKSKLLPYVSQVLKNEWDTKNTIILLFDNQ